LDWAIFYKLIWSPWFWAKSADEAAKELDAFFKVKIAEWKYTENHDVTNTTNCRTPSFRTVIFHLAKPN
jgi:hypothetical protein